MAITSGSVRLNARRFGPGSPPRLAWIPLRDPSDQHFRIVEITIPLLRHASQLADLRVLRAYDAVQLAAVLYIHRLDSSLVLLSADVDLNAAAMAEGLPVEDPNLHS